MCLPISIGRQCFPDFPPLLQHPGVYLLALFSLPVNDFIGFGDEWTSSGSCFSFYQSLLS